MSLDFLNTLSVLGCLILLTKYKLNIQTPCRMSLSVITAKISFLSNLLISLRYKSVKGVFYTRTDISASGGCFADISMEVSAEVR